MAESRKEELEATNQGTATATETPVATPGEQSTLTEIEVEEHARDIGVAPEYFEEEYTPDEYEAMLEMYEETLSDVGERQIVKARVQRITENMVILDVGFKSEGSVAKSEFKDADQLEPGAEVEVFLERLEDEDGIVVLSKKKADFLRVWEEIKEAYDNDEKVPGILAHKIKGGVTVDLMGVDAFLPGSQIALRRVKNIEDLIGQKYNFKILKLNKRRRNIVISRRVILEEEREEKRDQLVKELIVGQVRRGIVKNVTDFGAFIDLGGLDGLLHITDMSWGRVGHPGELLDIGENVDVKVLDIDWDRERISLGLKQLLPYPWQDIEQKYPVGARIVGRVVSITNYGAFIELEKGVEGLVHVSEMSWTRNVKHPSQVVTVDERIECVVLRVDKDDEKISLGIKQTEEDPWLALPAKYPAGTRVTGPVRNLTSFGAFVEVEPGIDGLIHISDMSWTKRIEHPSEVLQKGEDIEVVVMNVDAENKRISLGLKQIEEDPWYDIAETFEPGLDTRGSIVRILDEGLVVDLGNDIEGFVPKGEVGVEDVKELTDPFDEGMTLDMRVIESDPVNRRIHLTVTAIPEKEGGAEAGEELTTEDEIRPTEEQAAAQADAPESEAPADVPTAELKEEAPSDDTADAEAEDRLAESEKAEEAEEEPEAAAEEAAVEVEEDPEVEAGEPEPEASAEGETDEEEEEASEPEASAEPEEEAESDSEEDEDEEADEKD